MDNTSTQTLVIKDADGDFYTVPLETIMQGRVPVDQREDYARLISGGEDVQGHLIIGAIIAVEIGIGLGVLYCAIDDHRSGPQPLPLPNIPIPGTPEPVRGHDGRPQ